MTNLDRPAGCFCREFASHRDWDSPKPARYRACMRLRAIGVATLLSSWKDDASDSRFFRSRKVNAASLMASAFFSGQLGKCLSTALSSTRYDNSPSSHFTNSSTSAISLYAAF